MLSPVLISEESLCGAGSQVVFTFRSHINARVARHTDTVGAELLVPVSQESNGWKRIMCVPSTQAIFPAVRVSTTRRLFTLCQRVIQRQSNSLKRCPGSIHRAFAHRRCISTDGRTGQAREVTTARGRHRAGGRPGPRRWIAHDGQDCRLL